MKILVWYGKHGKEYFDATDEGKALKFLFTIIDRECGYYDFFAGNEEKDLYEESKSGDMREIKRFMLYRNIYEYERWEFRNVQTDANFEKRFNEDL